MRKLALLAAAVALVAGALFFFSSGAEHGAADAPAAAEAAQAQAGSQPRRGDSSAGDPARAAPVAVGKPGFVPADEEQGRPGATPPLDVPATAKDGFVEVQVKSRSAPASGAEVKLYLRGAFDRGTGHADWRIAGVGKTAADGSLKLPARPGSYLAVAKLDRSAPSRKQFIRPQGQPVTKVELELEAGLTLDGRTVQRGNQEPVALASITLTPSMGVAGAIGGAFGGRRGGRGAGASLSRADSPVEEIVHAVGDQHGRFHAEGLSAGTYRVEAQAPGHAKAAVARAQVPSTAEVVLELSASGFIEGTVTGADGKPAAGAQIAAVGGAGLVTGLATEQGTFSIEVDPHSFKVSAQKGHESATLEAPVVVTAGQTARGIALQLGPSPAIEGTVVTSIAGAPIANAKVTISPYRGEGQAGLAVSDAAGRFTAELPPGSYDVATTADGYSPDMRRGVTLQATQRFPLRIDLQGVGAIEGIVKTASGQPVVGAVVNALTMEGGRRGTQIQAALQANAGSPPEVRTGEGGRFRLDGLTPGRARLSGHRDGANLGDSQSVDVPEGGTVQAELTLRDEGVLTGRVGTKSGGPLKTAVTVRAVPTGGAMMILGPGGIASADTDANGVYRLVLPAATYNLMASAASTPGFSMPRSRNVATVEAGQTANKDLVLDDDLDAAVTGVVLEPGGEPSVGAMVSISGTTPGQRTRMMVPTDEEGKFTVAGSRAQLGALQISATNGGRAAKVLVAAEQTQVTVQLQSGGSLKGRVTGAGGTAVQGFSITVSATGGGRFGGAGGQQLEFAADTYSIDDVPAGDVRVSVKTRDDRAGDATGAVIAAQANQLDVVLNPVSVVTGRLIKPDGSPISGGRVSLDGRGGFGGGNSSDTTGEGRFKITGVQGGAHTLNLFAPPSTFKSQPITVVAGAPLDVGDITVVLQAADPGTIGATLRPDTDGVGVAFVLPGGPAETAGLRLGDLITAIDGAPVKTVDDATARIRGTPGTPVALTVNRAGNAIAVPVTRAM